MPEFVEPIYLEGAVDSLDPLPPLPTWTDAASVTSYLTSVGALVITVVEVVDPTGGVRAAGVEQLVLAPLGMLIAGAAQLVNVIWHRKVQAAAFLARSARR